MVLHSFRSLTSFHSSDLWSLGCIVFQMIAGKFAFQGLSEYLTWQKIKSLDYSFPEGFDEDAKDFISKLLVRYYLVPLLFIGELTPTSSLNRFATPNRGSAHPAHHHRRRHFVPILSLLQSTGTPSGPIHHLHSSPAL